MDEKTQTKIYRNEIVGHLTRHNLDPYELAQLIDEYFVLAQKGGKKAEEIASELGSSTRVLYKYRSVLKAPAGIIDKYKGQLSYEQISNITYSLKDKGKLEETLKEAVDGGISSKKLLYKVAEKNDASKEVVHIIAEIIKFRGFLLQTKERIAKLKTDDQKRIREALEDLGLEINKV